MEAFTISVVHAGDAPYTVWMAKRSLTVGLEYWTSVSHGTA